MILKGALAGFRVVEVPVSYYPRIGKSKISGTLKGTVGAGLVHSQLDRALLFPATKSRDTTASLSLQSFARKDIFDWPVAHSSPVLA